MNDETIKRIRELTDEKTLLFGYYGGGNFGDELLLESILFQLRDLKPKLSIYYTSPSNYARWHKYQYQLVSGKKQLLIEILLTKNICVGGGGIWGLDANFNVFVMSLMLLIARRILRKKVFLLGVGTYETTNHWGRIGRFLVGWAANEIYARDHESFKLFSRSNRHVKLCRDLVFSLDKSVKEMMTEYAREREQLRSFLKLPSQNPIALLSFRGERNGSYNSKMVGLVKQLKDHHTILFMLMPKEFNMPLFNKLKNELEGKVTVVTDMCFNPMTLLTLVQEMNSYSIKIMSPQFHMQVIASMANIPYMPLYYDDKNLELHKHFAISESVYMDNVSEKEMLDFFKPQ